MDSLILCKFLRGVFDDFYAESAVMLGAVTGWDVSGDELRETARGIVAAKREFNLRAGWTPAEDTLPDRSSRRRFRTTRGVAQPRAPRCIGRGVPPPARLVIFVGAGFSRPWGARVELPRRERRHFSRAAPRDHGSQHGNRSTRPSLKILTPTASRMKADSLKNTIVPFSPSMSSTRPA
jgi:hypothetical protein